MIERQMRDYKVMVVIKVTGQDCLIKVFLKHRGEEIITARRRRQASWKRQHMGLALGDLQVLTNREKARSIQGQEAEQRHRGGRASVVLVTVEWLECKENARRWKEEANNVHRGTPEQSSQDLSFGASLPGLATSQVSELYHLVIQPHSLQTRDYCVVLGIK